MLLCDVGFLVSCFWFVLGCVGVWNWLLGIVLVFGCGSSGFCWVVVGFCWVFVLDEFVFVWFRGGCWVVVLRMIFCIFVCVLDCCWRMVVLWWWCLVCYGWVCYVVYGCSFFWWIVVCLVFLFVFVVLWWGIDKVLWWRWCLFVVVSLVDCVGLRLFV